MCGHPRSHLLHSAASLQCFSLPRFNIRVGFHITFLAWSKLTARCSPHARRVQQMTFYLHQRLQPFRHLHDCSHSAGWSDSCRVGLSAIGEIAPSHGAGQVGLEGDSLIFLNRCNYATKCCVKIV
jgi:hypothetical protein